MRTAWVQAVRAYVVVTREAGGDYYAREKGHWITDAISASPMSRYSNYKERPSSWGADCLGSVLVEIELADGTIGTATGTGGEIACFIIERHLSRFVVGTDPRDISRIWDQMYRATLPYGRKGVAILALGVVDLALWDALGKLRNEPVYKLIGGQSKVQLPAYCTGPKAAVYKDQGFFGAKVPLPYGASDAGGGLEGNVEYLTGIRKQVGDRYPLMVDCFMSLDVRSAIEFANATRHLNLYWIEEALQPDNWDGYRDLKAAAPWVRWATGEHEYTRFGFRELIETRAIDVVQPDVMYVGGLTEALRVAALASAFEVSLIPHCSGPYGYHLAVSQPDIPMVEYLNTSPDGDQIMPLLGKMYTGEPVPLGGHLELSNSPGWGLDLNRSSVELRRPYTSSDDLPESNTP